MIRFRLGPRAAIVALACSSLLVTSCTSYGPSAAGGAKPASSETTSTPAGARVAGSPSFPSSPGKPSRDDASEMADLIWKIRSGANEDEVIRYVGSRPMTYHPSAADLIYLRDIGASDRVLQTLLATKVVPPLVEPTVPPEFIKAAEASVAETTCLVDDTNVPPRLMNVFRDELAPYGDWVDDPDYGRCWQPTCGLSDSGWNPYVDCGQWFYTQDGWTWDSGYSWGWAPFHYGRWIKPSHGPWRWVPGHAWAPAWVSWRYAEGHVGWAPLPPAARFRPGYGLYWHYTRSSVSSEFGLDRRNYVFVPISAFVRPNPAKHVLLRDAGSRVHEQSVVSNNYFIGRNGRLVNEGVGSERVFVYLRQEMGQSSATTLFATPVQEPVPAKSETQSGAPEGNLFVTGIRILPPGLGLRRSFIPLNPVGGIETTLAESTRPIDASRGAAFALSAKEGPIPVAGPMDPSRISMPHPLGAVQAPIMAPLVRPVGHSDPSHYAPNSHQGFTENPHFRPTGERSEGGSQAPHYTREPEHSAPAHEAHSGGDSSSHSGASHSDSSKSDGRR